jgi:hypothetical protein
MPREDNGTPFPVERELTTPRAAGVAGIVFAGLFVTSIVLVRSAAGRSLSVHTVIRNATGHASTRAVAGLYLAFFAGVAFLWFMAVLRDRIGRREDKFFATVFMGSGLLFVGLFLAGAAALGGLAAGARFGTASSIDPSIVGYARSLGYTFLLVFATKAAGVFTIVTSTMLLRLARWPRWTAFSGYAAALVLVLSVTFFEPVILLFPAWVTAMSVYVLFTGAGTAGVSSAGVG